MQQVQLKRWRRNLVTTAMVAGCLVPVIAGGTAQVLGGLTLIMAVMGRWSAQPPSPDAVALWRTGTWIAFGTIAAGYIVGFNVLMLALGLVGWLLVHRAWTGKTAADDRLVLLFGLLLFLLGCILTISPWMGPVFAVFVVSCTPALMLCHLGITEAGPHPPSREHSLSARGLMLTTATMGPVALLVTGLFFVATPRVEASNLLARQQSEAVAGFDDNVALGDVGEIKGNPTIAARLEVTDASGDPVQPTSPYLRGAALDHFDGRRWTNTQANRERSMGSPRVKDLDQSRLLVQEVLVEPLGKDFLFGLPTLVGIDTTSIVTRDPNGTWRQAGSEGRRSYTAYSVREVSHQALLRQASFPAIASLSQAWLQLPVDLNPEVLTLARQVAAQAGPEAPPYDVATTLQGWLRTEFAYTVVPDDVGARQPLTDFLLVTRRGHCEYFATALAVMLRANGIPARLVNGFYGGEYNAFGGYTLFRQGDAHSWVEVYLGSNVGWVTFDATPAAAGGLEQSSALQMAMDAMVADWYGFILNYDLNVQIGMLEGLGTQWQLPQQGGGTPELSMRRGGSIVAGVALLITLGLGIRRAVAWLAGEQNRGTRGVPRGKIARIHARARKQIARRGWSVPASLPPVAAAEWLVIRAGPEAKPLRDLAWLLYRVRYAGEAEEALLPIARDAADRMGGLPRRQRTA